MSKGHWQEVFYDERFKPVRQGWWQDIVCEFRGHRPSETRRVPDMHIPEEQLRHLQAMVAGYHFPPVDEVVDFPVCERCGKALKTR
jgi:hypothetical protein